MPHLSAEHPLSGTRCSQGQNRGGSVQTRYDSEVACPTDGKRDGVVPRLCNYYRRLIPHFADEAVPLYRKTTELRVLPTPELSDAFAQLKIDLCDSVGLKLKKPREALRVGN